MDNESIFKKNGDRYGDYVLVRSVPVEELRAYLSEVIHQPSGAKIIHLHHEDPENVFCISLRTLPENSSGTPHVLEHTVLCGSEKFPVKDPFFSMTRRSLHTYMNALTGPDFTCYPAASQVVADFYNLLEVYLDAVFHPRLAELSFLQEGHRLEFEVASDPSTPLEIKGIVYNEMKGALSSPLSRLWQYLNEALFPGTVYSKNFGGDPKEIPSLTYEELLAFHRKYYQIGRAHIYFSGNIPLKRHLDFLTEHAFVRYRPVSPLDTNPISISRAGPKKVVRHYPVSSRDSVREKCYVALGWLTYESGNSMDALTLQILDLILMGTDAALLKRVILQSGLCKNVFSVFEEEFIRVPYALIFEGCAEENAEKIIDLVQNTLQEIVKTPLNESLIDAALHHVEFARTEINADHGPFGLSLIFKLMSAQNTGCPLEDPLRIHALFEQIRVLLKNPDYLPSFIRKYLSENTHFVRLVMLPDPELSLREEREEKEHLAKRKADLSSEEKEAIVRRAAALKSFQEEQEGADPDVLPEITLSDISKEPLHLALFSEQQEGCRVFRHPCFTNDIVYLDMTIPLPELSFEDLPAVKLFSYLLPHLGSAGRDYAANLNLIQSHTGGISSFLDVYVPVDVPDRFLPVLVIRGKALARKKEFLSSLMHDLVTSPLFEDVSRVGELLSQHFEELDHDLRQNSLKYAMNLSGSALNLHGYVRYFWNGLGYYDFIKKIMSFSEKGVLSCIENMKRLVPLLLHGNDYDLLYTGSEKEYDIRKKSFFGPLCNLEKKNYKPWAPDYSPEKVVSQGRITSSPVFFTSMALKTPGWADRRTSLLGIAANLFDNTLLHKLIREQGGAYGGGSGNRPDREKFYFYAYRDPNLASSLTAFRRAVEKVASGDFTERELEEAKLGVFQKIDRPLLPESAGWAAYTRHKEKKDEAFRKRNRLMLLEARASDVSEAVRDCLVDGMDRGVVVSFASEEALERESKKLEARNNIRLEIRKI